MYWAENASLLGEERFSSSSPTMVRIFLARPKLIACVEYMKRHTGLHVLKSLIWKVNPSSAPHHGGVLKRLFWSFKEYSMKFPLHKKEVLITTFCLFVQSLDNRPLTSVSSNPNHFESLTLKHFLLGRPSSSFPPLDFEQSGLVGSLSIYQHSTDKRNVFLLQSHIKHWRPRLED